MDKIKDLNAVLSGVKPFSSVSVLFDRLTSNSFKEDDYDGIPELVESINLQSSGPAEASRCVRKKLKYGSVHGQKRVITILGALVENCGPRFQTSFADERLVNQIKLTAADPLVDASVRRRLMRLLLSWQLMFSSEPTMRTVASLYKACGGGREKQEREAQRKRSEAEELLRKREEERRKEMQVRMDRKAAEKLQKEEDKKRGKKGVKKVTRFNYEQEKPMILNHLAISSRSATALVNALQHVNRERDSVSENAKVQTALTQVKAERKVVVRYIQLCQDEDMVGALIEANDRIMIALQLYDKLSKPSTSDSEDDEPLVATGQSHHLSHAEKAAQEDAEIEAVRQRLAAADVNQGSAGGASSHGQDDWEGEIEKLQVRQRRGIERHNSRYGSQPGGGGGAGAMQDLLDLDFDETDQQQQQRLARQAGSSGRAPTGASTSSHARTASSGAHGTLSDYSDYDSSDDEALAAAGTSAARTPNKNRSAYPTEDPTSPIAGSPSAHGAALEAWRSGRRPRIGEETSSLWSKEDEERWIANPDEAYQEEEDEEDPFADEWEEVAGRLRSSGAEEGLSHAGGRSEWAAV